MQVSQHVHALKIPFQIPLGPGRVVERFVWVGLICGEAGVALVDSGVAGSEAIIFEYLQGVGREVAELSRLILTHSHPDHIGAARAVQRASGCLIAAHGAELHWIEDVGRQNRERPVPGFDTLVGGPVMVDRTVADGDELDLGGGLVLDVLHTPGHSNGSISLLLRPDRVLFSGDAIPVPGDIPIYEDALLAVESIRRLKAVRSVETVVSAWDEPWWGAASKGRMEESLRWLQRIHETVLDAAGDGSAVEPMLFCEEVLGRLGLPRAVANPLVAGTIQAHLKVRGRRLLLEDP